MCSFVSLRLFCKVEVSLDVAVSIHELVLGPVWSSILCKTLRVGVPKDQVRTVAFTPVCWTGLGPEYCCLEETLPSLGQIRLCVWPVCHRYISLKVPRRISVSWVSSRGEV